MAFVNISLDEIKQYTETLPGAAVRTMKSGMEYVVAIPVGETKFEIHMYTGVDIRSGDSRECGQDAIRFVLYNVAAGKICGATKRVNRTQSSNTSIWDRCNARLQELFDQAQREQLTVCKKCGSHTVERTNRKTGQTFRGCAAFPNCCSIDNQNKKYPLIDPTQATAQQFDEETEREIAEAEKHSRILTSQAQPNETPLVEDDALIPTSVYPHRQFPFDNFNRVQSTIMQQKYWNADCNLVLGTSTSSGKTVSAELFMGHTLYGQNKVVLYISPLKSLTQEKFDEWTERYNDLNISIMTGDYVLTERRADELRRAHIICMTSEMVDSRTRNYKSEKSDWIYNIGLVVVDESHIISTGRGHAVEVGLMRFAKLNHHARILLLSATMPNVYDFKEWLTRINSKETAVINNTWRPTKLNWQFLPHTSGSYNEVEAHKRRLALATVKEKSDEKYLIFVHAKNTGHQLVSALRHENVEAQFHNADLELSERLDIERSFEDRKDGLRILVATSTIAWGRNLPARNVVIVGTTRGLADVDDLDIIQMSGRAGRTGFDDEGFCTLICANPQMWEHKIKNPRKILSTLLDPNILSFHILAEINNQEVWNRETIKIWFEKTLAHVQMPIPDALVEETISKLINWGMLREDEQSKILYITNIGKISATLYFIPHDVYHWKRIFDLIDATQNWDSDAALCYALGATPSIDLGYIPRPSIDDVDEYMQIVRSKLDNDFLEPSFTAYSLHEWLTQNEKSPAIRSLIADAERITGALQWMSGIKHWITTAGYWKALPLRVKYGVEKELVGLCQLPGVGAVRARQLYKAGVQSVDDVLRNKSTVQSVMKAKTPTVIAAAKQLLRAQQSEEVA